MDPPPSKKNARKNIYPRGGGRQRPCDPLVATRVRVSLREIISIQRILKTVKTTRQSRAYGTLNYWVYIFGKCSYRNGLFTDLHMYIHFAD